MKMPDLSKFDLDDLKELQKKLNKEIGSYEARKRKEALAAVEATARDHGFNLSELVMGTSKPKRKAALPKYRNPENSEQTWSGMGRKPGWVNATLAAGKSLEDLLISK